MSDVFKHSKLALSVALTVTTIVWSIGLFALLPAKVGAVAGDLVKSAGNPAVYLVDADGVTIHPFPHSNVYSSWGFPANFSSVLTTDLSGFTVGNDVEFRDGSLIRALETPAVYVVTGKKLRPIVSAEVFEALGYNYDNITWLPQSFLDKYGAAGSIVTSTTTHVDGTLVKYASSSSIYLLQNGQKREFASNSVLEANGYGGTPVITIPSSETYSDGSKIVVKETASIVPTGVGSAPDGSTTPPATGSGLSVSLSATNPASATVVTNTDTSNGNGQALVPFLKVNFTAGSDGAVSVTGLKFKRIGVSADEDVDTLYLYEGDNIGTALADGASVSSGTVNFNSTSGLFTVPAGQTKTITLRGDLLYSATSGKTIGFDLTSVSDVTTSAAVSGSFPLKGNVMSLATATDLGRLSFTNYASTPSADNTSIDPSQSDQEVWKTTFQSTGQELEIHSIKYTEVGSVQREDINNFRLYHSGTLLATVAEMNSDFEVVFDLSSDPLVISKGSSKVVSLRADIIKGSTREFYFSFQDQNDVIAKDTNFNVFVQPYTLNTWSVIKPDGDWQISSGSLSVSKSTDSPTDDVTVDAINIVLGEWDFRAAGEDIKIKNLDVQANVVGGANGGIDNGKILVNGSQLGSTKDLTEATDVNFTFGSTFIVPAGETYKVQVVGDVKTTTSTSYSGTETIAISIGAGSSNAQRVTSLGTFNAPSSDVAANTITIAAASLSVFKFSGYANQTVVAGTNNARLGSFVLSPGASEGTDVSSVTVALSSNEAATITNLWLRDVVTGEQIGDTKASPSTSNIFSVNFNIEASGSKVIDLVGNIISGSDDGEWIANIDADGSGAITGNSVSATAANIQTITIGSGSLFLNNGSHPASDIIVAGGTGIEVGEFTFSSQNEDFTITKLNLKTENNFATTTSSVKITYTDKDGQTKTASSIILSSTSQSLSTATFENLAIYVPKDGDVTITVSVDTVLLSSSGASGASGNFDIDWNNGFKATGGSGTNVTTVGSADISGNTFYIRKSKPTFTRVAVTGSNPGGSTPLYKFSVVADSAGNIEIKQLAFDFATSGASISQAYLYYPANQEQITDTKVDVDENYEVELIVGGNDNDVIIANTSAKTYEVRATVTGWGDTGDSVDTFFVQDTSAGNTASAETIITTDSQNIVWSDRSVSDHSTTSSDWTNGYLLRNMTDVQSF